MLRQMGGGVHFCMPSTYSKTPFSSSSILLLRVPFSLPSCRIFRQSGQIFGKKGQKLTFICLPWCFLGKIGDRKRQKPNIFLKCGCSRCGAGGRLLGLLSWRPLVQACRLSGLVLCFRGVSPPFVRFPALPFGGLLANMPLFRILRRFIWVYRLLVWVCSFWVICVACGAFVCVRCLAVLWLVACFAFLFVLLSCFYALCQACYPCILVFACC